MILFLLAAGVVLLRAAVAAVNWLTRRNATAAAPVTEPKVTLAIGIVVMSLAVDVLAGGIVLGVAAIATSLLPQPIRQLVCASLALLAMLLLGAGIYQEMLHTTYPKALLVRLLQLIVWIPLGVLCLLLVLLIPA